MEIVRLQARLVPSPVAVFENLNGHRKEEIEVNKIET